MLQSSRFPPSSGWRSSPNTTCATSAAKGTVSPRSLLLLSRSKIKSSPKTIPTSYRERPETLRALSQTSRALRAVFLPLLWEYVEACFIPKDDTTWSKRVASVLLKRCKGLMKNENQSLAQHVRVFSVSLSSNRMAETFPLLAQCLASLPNLDTLHILHLESKREENVTAAFKNVQLPGVRCIILPSYAHAILAACPGVRDVSCNEEIGTKLFDTLIKYCPSVERIQGFQLTSSKLKKLSKSIPNLREIAVPATMNISSLSVLKHLSAIELITDAEDQDDSEVDSDSDGGFVVRPNTTGFATIQAYVAAARSVLSGSSGTAPKRITVSYWQDITEMWGMADITYGQYWERAEEFDV
ncbi:hypothetical protein C8R46DRAFT_997059 [Mycena filopes]|nr:hypothetical protein C8R46DRAFT_997059 [Mycena filopes]